jgi:hypothetical protein
MSVAAQRYKIVAHMFHRAIRNLDQIQNSSTAQAREFGQRKIDLAKDAIRCVVEELEARAEGPQTRLTRAAGSGEIEVMFHDLGMLGDK